MDIDPEAVRASSENAALNGVSQQLELGIGSVKEVAEGKFGLQQAELIFANILAPVLVQLLDHGMGELVLPGGSLILSGILAEQSPWVETALKEHGFTRLDKRQIGDWVALAAQR